MIGSVKVKETVALMHSSIANASSLSRLETHPELVIVARGALLDEGSIVGGDISVVGVLLQHVDLQLDFLLFVLNAERQERKKYC